MTRSPPIAEIYLDWNATTPLHPEVIAAQVEAASTAWGNPASVHGTGRRARAIVEGLREELAGFLGFEARDIILTSGGTEANNLALAAAPTLVTSRLEHPSVVRVAEALAGRGTTVRWLPVPATGQLEANAVRVECAGLPAGGWVAVQAANHETGVLQPIAAIAEVVHAAGQRLHVDAVQALGKVELAELGLREADSVAVTAHKIRGPKGVGALCFRGRPPQPVLLGGAQERGLRPGTVDAVAAAGFHAALGLARSGPARWVRIAALRDSLERALADVAQRNGAPPRLPHVTNLSFAGVRGDELVAALDLLGVRVSSGSACAAGTAEPSPVITAMLGAERAASAVRVSLSDELEAERIPEIIALFFQALRVPGAEGSRSA